MRSPLFFAALVSGGLVCAGRTDPFVASPRAAIEIPSGGGDWETFVTDDLDLTRIPADATWTKGPGKGLLRRGQNRWSNSVWDWKKNARLPHPDCVKWHRRTVEVSADYLRGDKAAAFHVEIARMAMALFVNGRPAGVSYQASLPKTLDVTGLLKPGRNEIVFALTSLDGMWDEKNLRWRAPFFSYFSGGYCQGPIRLDFRPKVRVDDVFVRTHVAARELEIVTTVRNDGDRAARVTPHYRVAPDSDPWRARVDADGEVLEVPAHGAKVVTFRRKWTAPLLLWEPDSQYFFYDAEVSLAADGRLADRYPQKFAWREVTVQGRDIFLNGRRIFLSRASLMGCSGDMESWDFNRWRHNRGGMNAERYHLGDLCWWRTDWNARTGIYTVPELSMSYFVPPENNYDPAGVSAYCEGVAKLYRNNPSVILYSLANETVWASKEAKFDAVCDHYAAEMRKWAPDQLLSADADNTWNGRLDVCNIHYPENEAGTLNRRYPNAGFTLPNDLWWVSREKGAPQGAWRTQPFDWSKPVIIGEYYFFLSSAYVGDGLYAPSRWARESPRGMSTTAEYDPRLPNASEEANRMMSTWYRYVGFAGLNPWVRSLEYIQAPCVFDPHDVSPNWFAGETFERRYIAINNGGCPVNRVHWSVRAEAPFFQNDGEAPLDLPHGSNAMTRVTAALAASETPYRARVEAFAGFSGNPQASSAQELFVWPRKYDLSALASRVAVLGDGLEDELKALGLSAVRRVKEAVPAAADVLIVAPNAFCRDHRRLLDGFWARGGTALFAAQREWQPWRCELPKADFNHAATMAWIRDARHPVLAGVPEASLRWWRGGAVPNVVSTETFLKPETGDCRCLLECGGTGGVKWTPLLETKVGAGRALFSSFATTKDPVWQHLAANAVRWAAKPSVRRTAPLALAAGANARLKPFLDELGVATSDGFDAKAGTVLADLSAAPKAADVQALLARGGTLWLHAAETNRVALAAALAKILPDAKLADFPANVFGVEPVNRPRTDLLAGIANYDFAWYKPCSNMEHWDGLGTYWRNATKTCEPPVARLANAEALGAVALTEPCALAEIRSGRGRIVLDLLPWETAVEKEGEKVRRALSQFCRNLGCTLVPQEKPRLCYRRLAINDWCNLGWWDTTAGDGKGGWSDEGRDDMRMYLVNHVGRNDYEETGMPTPVPLFPQNQRHFGVPFFCPIPAWNRGCGVVSFAEKGAPKDYLRQQPVTLRVGAMCETLHLLDAATRADGVPDGAPVASVKFDYFDGSSKTVVLALNRDVGDWKKSVVTPTCRIAWSGRNKIGPRFLSMTDVKNPAPEKKVRTVGICGGLSSVRYILAGATASSEYVELTDLTRHLVLASDFSNPTNYFPRSEGCFWYGNDSSAYAWDPATKGATFHNPTNGAFRVGLWMPGCAQPRLEALTDFMRNPFEIEFDITFHSLPDGRRPRGATLQTNFEIVNIVNGRLRGFDMPSHEPPRLGHRYRIRLRWDGWTAWYWLDGVLQGAKDMPDALFAAGDMVSIGAFWTDATYYPIRLYKIGK